ncbi:MAG: IPT/TIG domain-containing protein, partial [Micromonosporaceae bacterium]
VRFGATPATSFTVVSATEITAVAPVGAAGQVTVTVTSPGGTSAPGVSYFYLNTPALTSVNPQSGPLSGGNTVTLTGTSLAGTTGVTFGATPATSFTAVSATEITAVAPPGAAGPVQVTATTGGGTSNPVFYTYLAAPAVTTLSPDQGPTFGGNTVTLTGTGFTETTAVTFGAAPAAFTVVSDSQLTAVAPPGSAGPVNVSVTTPGGSSPAVTYTRVPPPAI